VIDGWSETSLAPLPIVRRLASSGGHRVNSGEARTVFAGRVKSRQANDREWRRT